MPKASVMADSAHNLPQSADSEEWNVTASTSLTTFLGCFWLNTLMDATLQHEPNHGMIGAEPWKRTARAENSLLVTSKMAVSARSRQDERQA